MKFLMLAFLIILTACSNKSQVNSFSANYTSSNATIDESSNVYDFGSMTNKTAAITLVYKFKNVSGIKLSEIPTATISGDSGFSIILQSGCSSPLNVNATCQVRVMFNPKNKLPGVYQASLKIGSSPLSNPTLTATVIDTPPPVIPVGVVNYYDETATLLSGSINLGVFTKTQSITKILTIKNDSQASVTSTATVSNSTDFSILNQCSNKTLAAGKSCSVRVTFSGAGKTDGATYSTKISFANVDLIVSASIIGSPPTNFNISLLDGVSDVTGTTINLGNLNQTDVITKTITIKNTGSGVATLASSTESDLSNFAYIDQCKNKALAAGASCTVRVTLSAAGKSGPYSTIISFLGKNVTITGNVLVADVITYSPTYSSYGSCSAVNPCDGQGIQSRTITKCNKVTNGVSGSVVDNSFCSSFAISSNLDKTCSSPAGDITVPISNGSKVMSCPIGSNVQTYKSMSCTLPYAVDSLTQTCILSQASTYNGNVMMFIVTTPSTGYEMAKYDPASDRVTIIDHFPGATGGVDSTMKFGRINGELYFFEAGNHKMLKYNPITEQVSTFHTTTGSYYLPLMCSERLFTQIILNSALTTHRYDPAFESGLTYYGAGFTWDPACTTEQNKTSVTMANGDIYDYSGTVFTKNGVNIANAFTFVRIDSKLVMINDDIYFSARSSVKSTYNALYKYNTLNNQFSLVVDSIPNYGIGRNIEVLQHKIFYSGGTAATGAELGIYDADTQSSKIYDIVPGAGSSYAGHPHNFVPL